MLVDSFVKGAESAGIENQMEGVQNTTMKKEKLLLPILVLVLTLMVSGCGKQSVSESPTGKSESVEVFNSKQIDDLTSEEQAASKAESVNEPSANENKATQKDTKEDTEAMLQMRIGDKAVNVESEDNESVQALRDLCTDKPLTIQMSKYGGFEQVGSLGRSLPRDDHQTTTGAGDIVLYSGNQIVVFYGANSWAYTRLGHITDQNAAGMSKLLGNGDVTITLSIK